MTIELHDFRRAFFKYLYIFLFTREKSRGHQRLLSKKVRRNYKSFFFNLAMLYSCYRRFFVSSDFTFSSTILRKMIIRNKENRRELVMWIILCNHFYSTTSKTFFRVSVLFWFLPKSFQKFFSSFFFVFLFLSIYFSRICNWRTSTHL